MYLLNFDITDYCELKMEPNSTKAPQYLPLVFPPERKLYDSHIKCLYDNDTFAEILNEDYDSFVLNPWS